jgi:hypothetical protein
LPVVPSHDKIKLVTLSVFLNANYANTLLSSVLRIYLASPSVKLDVIAVFSLFRSKFRPRIPQKIRISDSAPRAAPHTRRQFPLLTKTAHRLAAFTIKLISGLLHLQEHYTLRNMTLRKHLPVYSTCPAPEERYSASTTSNGPASSKHPKFYPQRSVFSSALH